MSAYIAGPMTNVPAHNFPAFSAAAKLLRSQGRTVVSPHELFGGDTTHPYEFYLRNCLKALLACDELVLLPGWDQSRGASLERHIAQALGMPITHWGCLCGQDCGDDDLRGVVG